VPDPNEPDLVEAISEEVDDLSIDHDREALARLLERRAHDLAPTRPDERRGCRTPGESWEIAEESRLSG
jgi:hypothetical protein